MYRVFAYIWLIGCAVAGVILVADVEDNVHGSVAPDFCTDCPQFKQWLETQDG